LTTIKKVVIFDKYKERNRMTLKKMMTQHYISAQELSFESRIPRTTILYILDQDVFNPKFQVALKLIEAINRLASTSYIAEDLL